MEPEDIGGAVACWVADDIGIADGASVTSWTDRIGGFTAVDFGTAPIYDTTGICGHPSVHFGSDGGLEYAAANAVSTATSGSVFAIVNLPSLPASADAIWASTNTSFVNNAYHLWGRVNTGGLLIEQDNGFSGTDSLQGDSGPYPTPDTCLIEWRSDGSTYSIWIDGVNVPLSILTGANTGDWFGDTTNRGNFTIGARKTSGGAFGAELGGDIAVIVVADGAVSSGDRAGLLAWMRARCTTGRWSVGAVRWPS